MFRAELIGAGVTLALIVIPIVHFLTVWFASFVGGFIAGSRVAANDGGALVIPEASRQKPHAEHRLR